MLPACVIFLSPNYNQDKGQAPQLNQQGFAS